MVHKSPRRRHDDDDANLSYVTPSQVAIEEEKEENFSRKFRVGLPERPGQTFLAHLCVRTQSVGVV
jgi:hypothetical protein